MRSLRLDMVVHVVLSCLEVSVALFRMHQRALMWRRLSPRRRPSSTRSRQSSHGFDVLVVLAPRCHRGLRHRDMVRVHLLDHRVCP